MIEQDNNILTYWKQLNEENFSKLTLNKNTIMEAIHHESNQIIPTIKKRLKAKLNWIVFFVILFSIGMVLSYQNPELMLIVGLFNLIYVISFFLLYAYYKKMHNSVDYDNNLLNIMKHNFKLIKQALNIERIFGIITFPLAVIGGSLISRLMKGYSLYESLHDEKLLLFLLGGIIVLVPLMYIMSEKMNKAAFGKLNKNLKQNIIKLEMLEH